ncbi:MAG: hypothetical protein H6541_01555 [Lentimicrobiaceae bacterium]|nr:hypothetical protein [Lentimicrobiaceae bacterium]MCB9023095.1 hypothetical protein [Lentimicrobiaceae bacterium]MCO5264620.1 periplasmic heavy metal sensor [Lentimicrobium sp.]
MTPTKTRIFIFTIVVLTIINLAAVTTVIYKIRHNNFSPYRSELPVPSDSLAEPPGPSFFIKEMDFNPEQEKLFREAREDFREVSKPLFLQMNKVNTAIIDEVTNPATDTVALRQLCNQAGNLQARIKMNTALHLKKISNIAGPDKQDHLSYFYREMISRDSGPNDKGRQHRYRHGRNNRN